MGQQKVTSAYKKFVFVCFLMAGLLPCLLYSQPVLTVEGGTEFTFGEIPNFGPSHAKVLIIRNTGTDTLVIQHVYAICGCTGTLLSGDHIPPNDSAQLEITFDQREFTGNVTKTVQLATNDPARRTVTINFTSNVVKALDIDPEYVFVTTSVDSTTTVPITISNLGTTEVRILTLRSSDSLVRVRLSRDKVGEGEDAVIEATFTPKHSGMISGDIGFTTDHPLQPSLDIRFKAYVREKSHP